MNHPNESINQSVHHPRKRRKRAQDENMTIHDTYSAKSESSHPAHKLIINLITHCIHSFIRFKTCARGNLAALLLLLLLLLLSRSKQ
jgi:hypothetical protein